MQMYIYKNIFIYIHVQTYIHVYTYTYISKQGYTCVFTFIHMCTTHHENNLPKYLNIMVLIDKHLRFQRSVCYCVCYFLCPAKWWKIKHRHWTIMEETLLRLLPAISPMPCVSIVHGNLEGVQTAHQLVFKQSTVLQNCCFRSRAVVLGKHDEAHGWCVPSACRLHHIDPFIDAQWTLIPGFVCVRTHVKVFLGWPYLENIIYDSWYFMIRIPHSIFWW